jgi:hypothetical protein
MATKKQAANTEPTKPAEPVTVDYVIGTNKGHAQRTAKNQGHTQATCIAVDKATPELLDGKNVVLARDPNDRAANWADIETMGCTIIT